MAQVPQATEVRGIIYLPQGDVKVNGSNSVFTMDQVIACTFQINGSGGTVNVLRDTGVNADLRGRRPGRVAVPSGSRGSGLRAT